MRAIHPAGASANTVELGSSIAIRRAIDMLRALTVELSLNVEATIQPNERQFLSTYASTFVSSSVRPKHYSLPPFTSPLRNIVLEHTFYLEALIAAPFVLDLPSLRLALMSPEQKLLRIQLRLS